jgi:DNA polymerase
MSKKVALERLYAELSDCSKCGLRGDKNKVVSGRGNPDAEIMIIGEAPGRMEEIQGEPFVGAAGKFLNELLSDAGLSRNDVYVTNVVKCRPPGNRAPTPSEIASCRVCLDREIEIVRPKLIITLGRHSSTYIFAKADLDFKCITKEHGKMRQASLMKHQLKLLPSYHPAAALYNPKYREMLIGDFELLGKFLRKEKILEQR